MNAEMMTWNPGKIGMWKMKNVRWVLSFVLAIGLLMGFTTTALAANCAVGTTVTSVAAGNWTNAGTWDKACTPVAGTNVNITGNYTVTLNTNASCANLQINFGSTLANANRSLTVNGDYINNGTHSGTNGLITLSGAGSTIIDGNGKITNPNTFSISTGAKTIASTANLTFAGTIAVTGAVTVTNNGRVTTTAAGGIAGNVAGSTWVNAANSTLNIAGPLLPTGTLTATASPNTVNYNGAAQTVKATTYNNLILSGSGAKTMPAGVSASGNLSIAPTGSATASVAAGQNFSVGSITLGGLNRINGTWGSTSSSATYKINTYFASTTGYLTVSTDTRSASSINTPPTSAAITYGQTLASSGLSGGSGSPAGGAFTWTTPVTAPNAGTSSQSVTYTPTDLTSYTIATGSTSVTVNKRAITVTAVANAKTYDGTTFAAAVPTITLGSLVGTDTASWTETYAGKNIGTGLTLTPAGTVNDGNSGSNYSVTFANNTSGVINARAITVTAAANTKPYDGTMSAAAVPTITSGSLVGTDTASWTETYNNKNVGTGLILTPAGTVNDGNDGNNYAVTFVNNTSGAINAKALTVSAAGVNKEYDNTTTATVTLSDNRIAGDLITAASTGATFADKNVGIGKTVMVTGISISGIDAGNYTANTTASTTADITGRAITVTAAANTKTYDGTTAAAAVPTITSGSLMGTDTASWTETYNNKNVGTVLTVIPAGTVNDGNDGNNYAVTFVNNTSGVINARALTVSAVGVSKVYDGTTAAIVTLSDNHIAGDVITAAYTGVIFADKNVGAGKTVSVTGITTSGIDAGNYSANTTASTTADITARAITVTAATNTKAYDATIGAAATPTITSGSLAGSDTANFSESYLTNNVGTGLTLTPSGSVTDGNNGSNYSVTFANNTTGVITARAITVTVATNTKAYDATTSAAATPAITSGSLVGSDTANFTESYASKNVGTGLTLTPSGSVIDGNSGGNYSVTFADNTTGVITARAITVTAATNSKVYDATTSAAATPTITSGSLAGSDMANFSENYAGKDAGTGLTLTPSGSVADGNNGNNYNVTFANNTTGVITARAITVTAAGNTKAYDATTSASATPTITSGSLAGSDTENFSESYASKNVGTSLMLTPSGSVNDGNSGNNYAVTFANNSTGVITARAITVTAATNAKAYDATTSAAATPTITSGILAGIDTANFSESYSSKNVGAGLTLIPAGSVSDGNSGNNYAVTLANNTTGVITARAITVTAAANTKAYDATTSAAATPPITSGSLAGSDTANFSESYASKNAGTGLTLTPSGAVNDGNSGNNYSVMFANNTTGVITARAITVTAATDTKTYDGTTNSSGVPTISSGSLAGSDTASWTQAFADKNAGIGKTLTPSGSVTDGNSGGNYTIALVNTTSGVIYAKSLTVTAAGVNKGYDGTIAATVTLSDNRIAGDTLTNSYTGATFADKNIGIGKTVSVAGISISGIDAANYTANTTASTTADITGRAITVTAAANTKSYDGTTSAAGVPTITSGSLMGTDTASWTETYASKNVGTGLTLTPAGTVNDGNGGNNYAVTFANNTAGDITSVTVTPHITADSKSYDRMTSATIATRSLTGVIGADDVSLTGGTATFADASAGIGKTVTATGLGLSGTAAGNYQLSSTTAATKADITAVTVTPHITADSKSYDGMTSATIATRSLTGVIGADDVSLTGGTATFADASAGIGKTVTATGLGLSGTAAGNYQLSSTTAATTADITNTATSFNATSPASGSYINTTAVGYALNKDVASGTVTFTRTGGISDGSSPHVYNCTGPDMTAGSHTITTGLGLVNGAIYTVSFDATDGAGYAATTVSNTNILYDASAAAATLDSPASSSSVNNATAGYTLSKDVASGRIVYSRTSGAADGASPHAYDLSGTELASGPHTVTTGLSLADGVVYTVDIENVVDLEGNTSAVVSNAGIRYDVTSVAITNTSPAAGSATALASVGYTLSEQASAGKVTFTRTGGAPDTSSPYVYTLSGADLSAGPHTVNTGLGLVDGTIYTVSFDATDLAGNNATTASNALVTFDQTAPVDGTLDASPGNTQNVITWSGFTDAASGIGSYTLVSSPTATPTDCSGTPIYTGSTLSYTHTGLTNGTTYYYRLCATDRAGNISAGAIANARPRPDYYNITTNPGSNGSISCSPSVVSYDGSSTCTIQPNAGYQVEDVSIGTTGGSSSSVGVITIYTINNITANMTISATFALQPAGAAPTASFTWRTDAATDYKVLYDASATVCPAGATCTYTWSTGETGVTTSNQFADSTTTTVTLTVTSDQGGSDSTALDITPKYVGSNPTLVSGLIVTPTGYAVTANYTLSGGIGPYTVKATWGDGTNSTTTGVSAGANTTSHTYANAGTYTVTITATDTGMNDVVTTNSKNASVTVVVSTFIVSGTVTRVGGVTPVSSASVTLKLNGVVKKLVYTDASGNYTMTGVAPGTYTATVAKSGLTFTNPAATITVTSSNVTGVNIRSMN